MWREEVRTASSVDKAHGRRERRRLDATERLAGYLHLPALVLRSEAPLRRVVGRVAGWPGLRQVCRIRRDRTVRGHCSSETFYAITSLPPDQADAPRLLRICRRHWAIENRLHCVRDLTLQEDRCRVRAPAAAQALAALRNAALTLLRRLGLTNINAALEHCADHRQQLIHLIRYGTIE